MSSKRKTPVKRSTGTDKKTSSKKYRGEALDGDIGDWQAEQASLAADEAEATADAAQLERDYKQRARDATNDRPMTDEERASMTLRFPTRRLSHFEVRSAVESPVGLGYEIRFNVRLWDYEYRSATEDEWQVVGDRDMNRFIDDIACKAVQVVRRGDAVFEEPAIFERPRFDRLFEVAFSGSKYERDPFRDEFLEQCRKRRPAKNLDTWMSEAGFEITNANRAFVVWACRYFFLAVVQRAYEPGCELHEIPTLIGRRGTGKSSAVSHILTEEQRAKYLNDGFSMTKDPKLLIERTEGKAVIEWSELAGVERCPVDDIKKILVSGRDRARKAYARRAEDVPRRWVMIATTNKPTLPADESLQRRIVAVHIAGGDVGKIRAYMNAHREALFAAAIQAYENGERANLPPNLVEDIDSNNDGLIKRDEHGLALIASVFKEHGDQSFISKSDFCECAGLFVKETSDGTAALITDRTLRSRIRDQWWAVQGRRYHDLLIDLGYRLETRPKRGYRLIDDKKSQDFGDLAHPDRTLIAPSSHPQNPICAEDEQLEAKNNNGIYYDHGNDHGRVNYVGEGCDARDSAHIRVSGCAEGARPAHIGVSETDTEEETAEHPIRLPRGTTTLYEAISARARLRARLGMEFHAEEFARSLGVSVEHLQTLADWHRAKTEGIV